MSDTAVIQSGCRPVPENRFPQAAGREGGDFASLLKSTKHQALGTRTQRLSTDSSEEILHAAAGQLVADAFILPLLQEMHDSPLRPQSGPFVAGTAEKRFMPLLDQHFADRITQSNHFPLVDSVVKHLSKASRQKSGGDHATA